MMERKKCCSFFIELVPFTVIYFVLHFDVINQSLFFFVPLKIIYELNKFYMNSINFSIIFNYTSDYSHFYEIYRIFFLLFRFFILTHFHIPYFIKKKGI